MMPINVIVGQCHAVILAGGQASRMGGCNKLLQCFDGQTRQLEKLTSALKGQVQQIWINSHRDAEVYRSIDANLRVFTDLQAGFLGPMIGMYSAWQNVPTDWILFVPCDVYQLPEQLAYQLAVQLCRTSHRLCYVKINGDALYPLCLMHRDICNDLVQNLQQGQYSLHRCFQKLPVTYLDFMLMGQKLHSINAWSEIQSLHA